MGLQIEYYNKNRRKLKGASLDELFDMLRSGKYAKYCNSLRFKLRSGVNLERNATIEDADRLPIVRFGISSCGTYTGYVLLSFKVKETDTLDAIRRAASILPQTLMCFAGSSGLSLKVVVPFTLPDGKLPGEEVGDGASSRSVVSDMHYFHQHAYYTAAKFYAAQLGLEPERQSPSIERGCRIGTDADAYLNPKALPIMIEQPGSSLTYSIIHGATGLHHQGVADAVPYANKTLPGYDDYLIAQTKFQYCYRNVARTTTKSYPPSLRATSLTAEGGKETTEACDDHVQAGDQDTGMKDEKDLDLFVLALAQECIRNGLEQEFSVKRLLHISPFGRYEVLVRGCFNNIYMATKMGSDSSIPEPTIEMAQLRHFLMSRYRFRRNSITNQIEYVEEGMYMFDWSPLTKEATNRITIEALMDGVVAWDKDVKRYVESTLVSDYDPVHDYLSSLPDWDGKDRVAQLARRVPTANTSWEHNFHTWMLSMVAQWMGLNRVHGSSMVPLIIGSQGDGKSTFCRLLLPEELRNYYTDRLDFANKNEAERALSRFCLINIDEYDSITKRQTAFLKHILQKTSVMSRQVYSSVIKANPRHSAFIATTNDLTPLIDPSGSRRYMCIRTAGVIDTRTPYSYPQLYAQLKAELQQGVKSWFDNADESAIQLQNRDFEQYDILQEVFNEFYHKPHQGETGEYLMVSVILHRLHLRYKSLKEDKSTYLRLGRYLMRHNFKRKKMNYGSLYCVVRNEQA